MTVTPPPAPSPAVAPPQPPEKPSVARSRAAAPAPSRVGAAGPDIRRDPTKPAGSSASRATASLNRATRPGDARRERVAAAPPALTGPGLREERTLPPVGTSSSTAQSSSPLASVPSAVPRVATPPPVSEARAEPARPAAPTPRAEERAPIAAAPSESVPQRSAPPDRKPKPTDFDAVASAPTPPATTPAPPTIEKRGFRVGNIFNYMPEVMLYRTLAPKVRALLTKPLAEEVDAQP